MKPVDGPLNLRDLEEADAGTLRQLWEETKGLAPPKTFTARLMRLSLAWDIQTARQGRESAKTKRDWSRIIREREKVGSSGSVGPSLVSPVRDGTRLLKEWGGKTHEVMVTSDGAIWNGERYSSLSALARAMTGTNRNGPKFFGLRQETKP
jgi:hypothetical protein